MSRGYPRFLFSNPKNSKSEGPFIVHTLYPRMIFTVSRDINNLQLTLVDQWDEAPEPFSDNFIKASNEIQRYATEWLVRQIMNKSIIPDFAENFKMHRDK